MEALGLPHDWHHKTYVMGILNVTPDSFSGDGLGKDLEAIKRQARQMAAEGADILDIGGTSTRPGATEVPFKEEVARLVPAIKAVRQVSRLPISVDTFSPKVASAALKAGAQILNDVHGFSDPAMVKLAADHKVPVIVMHSRGDSATMNDLTDYPEGLMAALFDFFAERTAMLIKAGVGPERIIIDPGVGFAKTTGQSWEVTRELRQLRRRLKFPMLYGASRKSSVGRALAVSNEDIPPAGDRLEGTLATTVLAVERGANIIRVHDVQPNVRIIRATRRILALDDES